MKCPKCEGTLAKVKIVTRPEYGGDILNDAERTTELEVDQCLECNGVWFDVNELEQYLAEKLIILNSKKVDRYKDLNKKDGLCPRCQKTMVKKPAPNKAKLMIDACEKCKGIWLDSTEIDQLEEKNFSLGEKHALFFRNLLRIIRKED